MQIEFLLMIIALPIFHLLGDFYLQSREMAEGKSKSNSILLDHVMVYTWTCIIPLGAMAWMMGVFGQLGFIIFGLVNPLLHFTTDYITSRYSRMYFETGNMKSFWRCIGVDQSIHWLSLMITMGCCHYVGR